MSENPESFARTLAAAHAEALRVGDSPLRADQLADRLAKLAQQLSEVDLATDVRGRVHDLIVRAEQVLRRDDDGKEAARQLKEALRHTEGAGGGPRGADRKAPWE